MNDSGLRRRPSSPPPSEGGGELKTLRSVMAEQLREANTGGVTSWLGLSERLDMGALAEVTAYRELLMQVLEIKLKNTSSGPEEDAKRTKARSLLESLSAYETGLKKKDVAA